MTSIKVTFLPDNKSVTVPIGTAIKDAVMLAGIDMDFPCGGEGSCKKCRVDIVEPKFTAALACREKLDRDTTVRIPDKSHVDRKKLLATIRNHKYPLNPKVKKEHPNYGLALDIGTTSVAGILFDLADGKDLAAMSEANSQSVFGADVVSRINYAISHESGLIDLQSKVIESVNKVIAGLCAEEKTETENISDITVVGNTVMQHLLLRRDVTSLSDMPFEPSYQGAVDIEARKLRFDASHKSQAFIFPHIAGFVGGDAVGLILALDLHRSDNINLAIDIGTNGEIVLGSSGKLLCTSTAAGPAFEGVRIKSGLRASRGAIESLRLTDQGALFKTIDNAPAKGICGSGLIDALAEMVRLGIVDETGRFRSKEELAAVKEFPLALLDSVITLDQQGAFVISNSRGNEVMITQRDVRELQLAKAAISAGIQTLEKQLGISDADIERIFIAGTFGNYINKVNARIIGLIPDVPMAKVVFVGNASAEGARLALVSKQARAEIDNVVKACRFVNLSTDADFQDKFADAMGFEKD